MRSMLLSSILAACLVGCSQTPMPTEMPQRPDPAPQLAKLDRMLGTWEGTAEMGGESYEGGNTCTKAMNGMFLKQEGWHAMPDGERMNFTEFVTWDAGAGKYHSWFFTDWGDYGEGWLTLAPDGDTLHVKVESSNAKGQKSHGHGTATFVDNDTMEWTWTETGPMGKMDMKGTSRRSE